MLGTINLISHISWASEVFVSICQHSDIDIIKDLTDGSIGSRMKCFRKKAAKAEEICMQKTLCRKKLKRFVMGSLLDKWHCEECGRERGHGGREK